MDDQPFNRAMLSACRADRPEALAILLEERPAALTAPNPYGTWLHVAASVGSLRIANYLLQAGVDPNTKGGTFGGTALNEAASYGNAAVVRRLLEAGALLDTSEPERNPLFGAIHGGHLEVVMLLVEGGIDPRVAYTGTSMKNMDARAFALERGHIRIAEYLQDLDNVA